MAAIKNETVKEMIENLLNEILEKPDTIIALCSFVVSLVAVIVSLIFAVARIRHNKKSVFPIGLIIFNDREEYMSVDVRNAGIGPLIIKNLQVYKTNEGNRFFKNRESKPNLIDWLPNTPDNIFWSGFVEDINVFTITPGERLHLIEIEFEDKSTAIEEKYKSQLRKSLKDLTVEIEYEDVYGRRFKKKRNCDWFGRLIE